MTKKNMQVENEATLSNKRIALLGGSSGIGLAVAQQVVEQGAQPVIASSNAERVQKPSQVSAAKRKGTHSICPTRLPLNVFLETGSLRSSRLYGRRYTAIKGA